MLTVAALIVVLIAFIVVQVRFYMRRRRLRRMNWDDLVAQLQPVNLKGIEEIAENYLHPSKSQLLMEPPVMWALVGKWKGFDALKANASIMLDLAAFASRWDETEGSIVAALIRRDGLRLKRAVLKIELMVLSRSFRRVRAYQLQEVAAAYHLMRGRLLVLYEAAQSDLYSRLAEAV